MAKQPRSQFASPAEARAFAPLSARETEVAKLIAADLFDVEIGTELGIARDTVRDRVKSILLKLRSLPVEDFPYRVRTRVGVAVWYLQAASQQ
jgi:DNA-binding NarL/FixJ family response regulator